VAAAAAAATLNLATTSPVQKILWRPLRHGCRGNPGRWGPLLHSWLLNISMSTGHRTIVMFQQW
jgi:hypothetical protein